MNKMDIFFIAFSLFIVMDAFGNIPLYMSLLKGIPPSRQFKIIIRELVIALVIIIAFYFAGEALLKFLHIDQSAVSVSGGIILFLLALKMIFPPDKEEDKSELKKIKEPFIVPLAIPLVAGPAVLATVMLMGHQQPNVWVMLASITLAWLATLLTLIIAPPLSVKLGEKGLIAAERFMGLILIFMSVQMFLAGIKNFFQ